MTLKRRYLSSSCPLSKLNIYWYCLQKDKDIVPQESPSTCFFSWFFYQPHWYLTFSIIIIITLYHIKWLIWIMKSNFNIDIILTYFLWCCVCFCCLESKFLLRILISLILLSFLPSFPSSLYYFWLARF